MSQASLETRRTVDGEKSPPSLLLFKPALFAAIFFIVGILLHDKVACVPLMWGAITLGLAIASAVMINRERAAAIAVALAITTAGIGIAQLEQFYYPRSQVSAYTTDTPRLAWLELYIEHEPRILTDPYSKRPLPPKQVATARVLRVKTWDGWRESAGEMLVQIRQPHPRLAASQTIRVLGTLERPSPATNPGQFDWINCALADSEILIREAFWRGLAK